MVEMIVERKVTLGLIQMSCAMDVQTNIDKAIGYIEEAAGLGAQIVCTQELFKSHYFCQVMDRKNFDLAEEINENNHTVKHLGELANKLKIVLVAGLFEKRANGIFHNTAVVIDADGSLLGKYRKMHIPQDPGYTEKFYFTPGDLGYPAFKTRYADIGVLICWDQWFPEAARLIAMKGAEIIFYPTAIGYSPPENENHPTNSFQPWQTVQQGHAIANSCFVATVNRVGFEEHPSEGPGINFWGQSFVADPQGRLIKKASSKDEEILICEIDLSSIDHIRNRESFPFRDRRVDSYQDLTKLYSS
jgi:N-carbamoylputrescine amidase